MTRANPQIDLGSLARPPLATSAPRPRRRWAILALPFALLAGFLAVLATSLGDWLGGALEVDVVRPLPIVGGSAASDHAAPSGAVVVQAAGWVEPDPFPIRVSALTEGIVRDVLVQESDAVDAGDPIATLVDEDARLGVREAEARVQVADAELALAEAERHAANQSFQAPLALQERLATAEAELAGKRAETERRDQATLAARAALAASESELEVQRYLAQSGAAGPRAVELAESALASARAEAEMLAADAELARAGARAAEALLERARRELELRIEDELRVASAESATALARARRDEAEVALDAARLRLERTVVRAPTAGVVLQRLVAPGTALNLEAGAVATLYDPSSVRVRVDVPQGELERLAVGQAVRIEADARAGRPYAGEVLRIVRQADINKVTLQAHVRVLDADELLRPEMLVQARFLASGGERPEASGSAVAASAVRIPAALVVDGSRVWVLDASGRSAELRSVRLGARVGDEAEVVEGLNLSDKVIAAPLGELSPGLAVRPRTSGAGGR